MRHFRLMGKDIISQTYYLFRPETHSRSSVSILRENTKFSINFWARVVNAFHKINKIENAKRKANSTK